MWHSQEPRSEKITSLLIVDVDCALVSLSDMVGMQGDVGQGHMNIRLSLQQSGPSSWKTQR